MQDIADGLRSDTSFIENERQPKIWYYDVKSNGQQSKNQTHQSSYDLDHATRRISLSSWQDINSSKFYTGTITGDNDSSDGWVSDGEGNPALNHITPEIFAQWADGCVMRNGDFLSARRKDIGTAAAEQQDSNAKSEEKKDKGKRVMTTTTASGRRVLMKRRRPGSRGAMQMLPIAIPQRSSSERGTRTNKVGLMEGLRVSNSFCFFQKGRKWKEKQGVMILFDAIGD